MGFKQVIQNRKLASVKPFKKKAKWHPEENSPRRVGLILCLDDVLELDLLKKVQTFFVRKGAKCRTCIYQKNPKLQIPEEWINENVVLLNPKSVNWYGLVRLGYAEAFLKDSFDIVVDLSMSYCFTTVYIASLAKATLKIGRCASPLSPFRIVLGPGQSSDEDAFLHLLDHSLQFIRFE